MTEQIAGFCVGYRKQRKKSFSPLEQKKAE